MNPFTYRPPRVTLKWQNDDPHEKFEYDGGQDPEADDWDDNWLSNAFAWCANNVWPSACSTPTTWTSVVSNYLWTDCSCCLFWRGAFLGLISGLATQLLF